MLANGRRLQGLGRSHAPNDPRELPDRNGQTLFEFCGRLLTNRRPGSSRQAISQHLAVLQTAGLVETRREGRYKFHYVNTRPLEPIIERWLNASDKDAGGRPDRGAGIEGGRGPI